MNKLKEIVSEKNLIITSLISFFGILLCVFLVVNEYRLRGSYTNLIILTTFVASTIFLFIVSRNKIIKRICGAIIFAPLILIVLASTISGAAFLIIVVLLYPFQPPMAKFKIDKTHNVEVRYGGFFACGESLILTEKRFIFFEKEKHVGNNSCV